jgi:FixJ family two-component response regulator
MRAVGARCRYLVQLPHPVIARTLAHLNLILVDDDQDIRRTVGRFLRSYGHDVVVFESAEAYLASGRTADCMILDLELPGLGGFDLGLRMREDGDEVPLVFITGHDEMAAAVVRSTFPCVMKPLDEERLLDAISLATSDGLD